LCNTGFDAVTQAFHLLNQFDVPVGAEHPEGVAPERLPSATQFTVAIDQKGMKLYYRTAWNSNIRCVELKGIDFKKCKYQVRPLDKSRVQPVEILKWHTS
jgi:choloylglycine hydrolase